MKRCVSCKCVLDAPGPSFDPENDAEKHDSAYPDHCRGCAVGLHDEAKAERAWKIREGRRDSLLVRGRRIALRPGEASALRSVATGETTCSQLVAKLNEMRRVG